MSRPGGPVTTGFLVVPQWQGSGSTRAMQLLDGAEAIRGDLPAAATTVVEVPLGAGESLGTGVRRLSSLQAVRERMVMALAAADGPVVTIGGDCGVDLAAVEHAHAAHPDDLALVWLDAHPDLNTPESSPSGAFHGMVLRAILGEGLPALLPESPVPASRVVLAGTRALDDPEADRVAEGIRMLAPADLTPDALVAAVAATGASAVYLHLDLDVLDPAEFSSLGYPEPFGVGLTELLAAIRALRADFILAGASVCEFAPPSSEAASDDLPTILRIIGALTG